MLSIIIIRRVRRRPEGAPLPININNFKHGWRSFKGKGMNEGGVPKGVTPDSDCNSNHPNSASFISVSSQDVDFVQDNSDYQWFLDYGYRDGSANHHTGILSLAESYEARDINYYDAFSKNMDANLAEADMESFRTEDIHALLTNLPPMCTDHLSQENNRQGECYASVSGSMMAKFDFDSSISPHSSSQGEDSTSMSICKSELLFSPVKEVAVPTGTNYSVDSLDCDFHDMMLTCQANKDNYTIAFEGSVTMYSEESDFNSSDKTDERSSSTNFSDNLKTQIRNVKKLDNPIPMTQSDSGSFTTWSKLKACNAQIRGHHHRPSGNNNNSGDDASDLGLNDNTSKSQSMPNLYKKKLIKSLMMQNNLVEMSRKPVKVFDIQHQIPRDSGSLSDMATSFDGASSSDNSTNNKQPNFNLVKLFMKQKSISTEGMSTTADQLSSTENWPLGNRSMDSNDNNRTSNDHDSGSKIYDFIAEEPEDEVEEKQAISRSIQTSQFSEIANLKGKSQPRNPVKIIEASFLNKLKKEGGDTQKPVYVLYPNYVLPNLDFLNEKRDSVPDVIMAPQKAPAPALQKKRPFSCNDLETLKAKGFSHVRDWDSLNFLLPKEYKEILADIPEVNECLKKTQPLRYVGNRRKRPASCDYTTTASSSSTATQPSSGYRGSSSILNDSENNAANPLFVYRYDSATSSETSLLQQSDKRKCHPERPPLPRGILNRDTFRNKRLSETEDEGVDAGTSSSSLDEQETTTQRNQRKTPSSPRMTIDELVQFEEFLRCSAASDADDFTDDNLTQLRSYVGRFLSLKMNQEGDFFGGRKTVSFAEKVKVLPGRVIAAAPNNSPNISAIGHRSEIEEAPARLSYNMVQKWSLVNGVTNAVELLTKHFSPASNEEELITLGDSGLNPTCAKIALTHLCPALYALLSDGLKPCLETSFGDVANSVWQVVEASAKQGPLTKALNELVMRINSEDAVTEGLVKFNTFVFGLLNVRSLDAWASYLRTRESVLRKHYTSDSLLILSHTGGPNVRVLLDKLITALQPLAVYPFRLDLFFETKQLQQSLKRIEALSPTHKWTSVHSNRSNSDSEEISCATIVHRRQEEGADGLRERPRSCFESGFSTVPSFKLGEDVTTMAKKRWSGIGLNSKLYQVYDRLAREEDEEYTDSLENPNQRNNRQDDSDENVPQIEPESLEPQPLNGKRFKKLQQRWEMLSGNDRTLALSPPSSPSHALNKSRIPRLITSPVKPVSGIPVASKVPSAAHQKGNGKTTPTGKKTLTNTRTSRVDQDGLDRHIPRPSSLPYKPATQSNKSSKVPPRRAVSSSLNRKSLTIHSKTPKTVRTLSHRLPSESGHLSYNEGEILKVILKVDDKWLLCCRGTQKGLVPFSAIISADAGTF